MEGEGIRGPLSGEREGESRLNDPITDTSPRNPTPTPAFTGRPFAPPVPFPSRALGATRCWRAARSFCSSAMAPSRNAADGPEEGRGVSRGCVGCATSGGWLAQSSSQTEPAEPS